MKFYFLLIALMGSGLVLAQEPTPRMKKALEEVGKYEVDPSGYVTFTRILQFDSIKKDDLFTRAVEYFTYAYANGENVLQVNDRSAGLLVGKGLYTNSATTAGLYVVEVDTWHILKIEVKDYKARVSVSLTQYREKNTAYGGDRSYSTVDVAEVAPIVDKGMNKNAYRNAFVESHKRAMASIDELEKRMRNGNSDW